MTARYCSKEMEAYGECVASKPLSWQEDCHQLKASVARCTSSHPIIQRIRQECAEPFAAFEGCLRQNPTAAEICTEHMGRFLQCAEKVKLTC